MIVARQGSPPDGPDDPLAMTSLVPRADYERQACWTLALHRSTALSDRSPGGSGNVRRARLARGRPVAHPGLWRHRVGRRPGFSLGLEPSAATILPGPHPEVTVSYTLKRPWLPGAPWSLTFRTEPAGATTPPLVVVAHPRAVPLSVDDGEIIARVPAARDGTRVPIVGRFRLNGHGVRVFPDPSVPPDMLVPIRFRHPETGSTRV